MSASQFTLASLADVAASAQALAPLLGHGDVVLLRGDIGAGKTTWVQALAAALGITDAVTSPTFALVQSYGVGALPLWHADLYRIAHPGEVANVGLDEMAGERGVLCVEWPECWVAQWPSPAWLAHLDLHLQSDESGSRTVTLHGQGARGQQLVDAWRARLAGFGIGVRRE